jgi:P27 family predicted phage terminase small subunit
VGARGPAGKPKLEVVRDGNPGKRSKAELEARGDALLPPEAPPEPDWSKWFTGGESTIVVLDDDGVEQVGAVLDSELGRSVASTEWKTIVPALDTIGRLATIDLGVLAEHCICTARIAQLERVISREGVSVRTERGFAKNPAVTAVNQYRTQLRYSLVQLMLTPAARARLGSVKGGEGGDPDNPFDF